jgi:hypothetical protein
MIKHSDKWNLKIGELVKSYKNREDFWIIHDGNGKPHIYEKTRTLITQLRSYLPIKLILILDENGDNIVNIRGEIEPFVTNTQRFDGIWRAAVRNGGDNILKVCFANRKKCQILLLITPESPERKVAEKLETKCGHSGEYEDPHIFINEVAKEGQIPGVGNACDIYKLACHEEWFKGEKWFYQLSQVFL